MTDGLFFGLGVEDYLPQIILMIPSALLAALVGGNPLPETFR